ncbi:MAG: cytochrome c3 family protein [Acidobacteria bacterium]|nr:cytochrome c3 family protein [Acidobacteriota bacterium]
MEIHFSCKLVRKRAAALLLAVLAGAAGCVQQPKVPGVAAGAADPYSARRWSSPAFTTAHPTYTDAAKHFLNVRPRPVQPIDFPHNVHTIDIGVGCEDCHSGVTRGALAGIPSIHVCMSCHEDIGDAADSRIQALRDHAKRGEDMAWQRVYGFLEESHVRFRHSPHVRAAVECATCHGDVNRMTVAERAVDHTMGFCINCHREKQASNDCLVCHY